MTIAEALCGERRDEWRTGAVHLSHTCHTVSGAQGLRASVAQLLHGKMSVGVMRMHSDGLMQVSHDAADQHTDLRFDYKTAEHRSSSGYLKFRQLPPKAAKSRKRSACTRPCKRFYHLCAFPTDRGPSPAAACSSGPQQLPPPTRCDTSAASCPPPKARYSFPTTHCPSFVASQSADTTRRFVVTHSVPTARPLQPRQPMIALYALAMGLLVDIGRMTLK